MARSERDIIDAHIADPAVTASAVGDQGATQNTGWGADSEVHFDEIRTVLNQNMTDIAANNTAIDAILAALEEAGIVASS